ncbi:hypothetical protein [Actinomadura roseirufa]|uniref:hypothetical protein n=1 Tax=Actinomadura roseirufa TaxID=2094049 RepID=UPI001040FAB4|nr:hypothetical protein [Actinomadura roseirufa]
MPQRPTLADRFVIGVDVEKYSARSVRHQVELQRVLDGLLAAAAEEVGLDRGLWARQPGGDGELAVLPADVDLLTVVAEFVRVLDRLLIDHNEDHTGELQVRLRVAMHIDTVTSGALGGGGQALIVLSRLLDCGPVRAALASRKEANLALILSEEVYDKVVLSELAGLRATQFLPVRVELPAKGFRRMAYVHLPGVAGRQIALDDAAPPESPSGEGKSVTNTISGERIDMSGSVFGFNERA